MPTIDPTIFKAYDIRTTYPDKINEENMVDIVRGIYTFFKNKLQKPDFTVVLGREVLEEEISSAFSYINPDNLHEFSIVVDPGNAMGILPVEELFKKITAN